MDSVEWRAYVLHELAALGVTVEKLPSGVMRLTNRHAYLMTSDLIHITRSDLRTFEGR
ncbi:hypothetical protein [Variovorax boronicumulans]|uniref:hypothetical protein n=1 Tax=Variovorax boronicumulans TaxID=436515 RepID=UPI0033924808